jgi:dolichol kinase
MAINSGIYLKIIIMGVFTWMILSIMKMLFQSTGYYAKKIEEKSIKQTDTENVKKTDDTSDTKPINGNDHTQTRGEPFNLVLMIIVLLVIMVFVEIKVGFVLHGNAGDYPAIIMAAVPGAFLALIILFNIIEYARGIEKKRRWGLKSETNELSERKKKNIDIQRKVFHLVAMGLLFMLLAVGDYYLKGQIDGGEDDYIYERNLANFWGSTDGLNYLEGVFVYQSIPIGQSFMILWMYGTLVFLMMFDITRLSKHVHFLLHREIQATLRYKEIDTFAAFTHFAVGYIFAAIILPPLIFLGTMCLITFADPAASIIGMRWGKRKFAYNNKSLEGLIAGMVACFVSMFAFVGFVYSLAGAILFGVIDMITPKPIKASDNIVMPIMCTLLFVVLSLLNIPCTNYFGF